VEEAPVNHFHIHWTRAHESKLDWDIFNTPEEAEAAAKQLVLPHETYVIEQFDGDCPRCNGARNSRVETQRRSD
jgi:hypothetical protein